MKESRPDIVKILVNATPKKRLVDQRIGRHFSRFGNIMDVARQYGIKARPVEGGIECEGPKVRLQIFVEKLHFSRVPYIEII